MAKHLVLALLMTASLLGGCGYPEGQVDVNTTFTDTLLMAPKMDVNSTAPPVFHPIFSAENYESSLHLVDLSYAVANEYGYTLGQEYPKEREYRLILERIANTTRWLNGRGWSSHTKIPGRTALNNSEEDITAIINSHANQRLIILTFHGSRSGSKSPFGSDGKGDWGANYDADPVAPSSVGLKEFPDSIKIHKGLAGNLVSARKGILGELDRQLGLWGDGSPVWIWVTGHSKGGAMAGLGAAMVKAHLNANSKYSHVKVGVITFSAPRVFYGASGKKWAYDLLGQNNIFRINVHGDPAPLAPSPKVGGYRSIGVLFLDFIGGVNLRTRQKYGYPIHGWLNVDEWANYHYGCGARGIGTEYDPHIVMRYSNLPGGFEEGRLHLKNK